MDRPQVVSREEWVDARRALLAEEKELTRTRDALNERRRGLPMVRVGTDYRFEGPDGEVGLPDLFEDRAQLIVFHMMWRWDLDAGCPSCSFQVDNIGHLAHLHAAGTTLAVVTRGPWASVAAYRERMGWDVPVYSSFGSDFNYDFHVTLDEDVAPVEYNYRTKAEHEQAGMPWHTRGEQPGTSVFVRDGNDVFHTYSTYARGGELLLTTFNYLDLTPSGRPYHVGDVPHRDRYGDDDPATNIGFLLAGGGAT
jgi:predicted dithiol-disulfide oxidoreductase (DUF899 family)